MNCSKKNTAQFQKSSEENFDNISKNLNERIISKKNEDSIDKLFLDNKIKINFPTKGISKDTLRKAKRNKTLKIKPSTKIGKNLDKYQKLSKTSGLLGISSFGVPILAYFIAFPYFSVFLILGGVAAISAIIFGFITLKKVKKKTMSILGISLGLSYFISLAIIILLLLLAILSIFESIDIF